MLIRPATHAGSWYTNSATKLSRQLETYFDAVGSGSTAAQPVPGARVLVGPHAGYTYSGQRLAEAFSAWDTTGVKRVFILGPSHHVYFRHAVMVSPYDHYATPLGNLPVDHDVVDKLVALPGNVFRYMSEQTDDDEHSFEMHAPYIYYKTQHLPQGVPTIVPILVSGMDEALCDAVAAALEPYLASSDNHFVISSDFCHWGSRFGYTKYAAADTATVAGLNLVSLRPGHQHGPGDIPIYKSIENLDRTAMAIAHKGDYAAWVKYIADTGNTICGQKPIAVVLRLLHGRSSGFHWLGYSQSNRVERASDSSVSYASGYALID